MRNLTIYNNLSPEDVYISIAGSKYNPCKDLLYESPNNLNPAGCIQQRVLKRYKEYNDRRYDLNNISPSTFSKVEKGCLQNCYTSDTEVSVWLLNEISRVQDKYNKDKCPYCGINSPTTIDHYLPKEIFPEFSVMSYNLVPCCADCNGLKGKKWTNTTTGERLFINFYFDEIPGEVFLKARISIAGNNAPIVHFSISPPTGTTNTFYQVAQNHYNELKVFTRIENMVSTYISQQLQTNKDRLKIGLEEADLKRLLMVDIHNNERNHGRNYWKTAVCRGILECDDFFKP